MINNVILVGRVVDEPKQIIFESGHKLVNFVLAVQKPFRNENNEYETDFIPIQAWTATADLIKDYVGKGSIIGLKCRVSSRTIEVNEVKIKAIEIIAERVTFISLNQKNNSKPKLSQDLIEDEIFGDEEECAVEEKPVKKAKNN